MLILPNRVINRCPAIILAVNRTLKEIGRIIFLRDSINTINGAISGGVFIGSRCVNIVFEKFIHLKVMKAIHRGKPIAIEIDKCLVGVNVNGINPIRLMIKINKKIDLSVLMICLLKYIKFISFSIKFKIINFVIEFRDSNSHILLGINKKIKINEIQFNWIINVVLGSKDENRFVIIFFRRKYLI